MKKIVLFLIIGFMCQSLGAMEQLCQRDKNSNLPNNKDLMKRHKPKIIKMDDSELDCMESCIEKAPCCYTIAITLLAVSVPGIVTVTSNKLLAILLPDLHHQ